jgi:hypothetical protein
MSALLHEADIPIFHSITSSARRAIIWGPPARERDRQGFGIRDRREARHPACCLIRPGCASRCEDPRPPCRSGRSLTRQRKPLRPRQRQDAPEPTGTGADRVCRNPPPPAVITTSHGTCSRAAAARPSRTEQLVTTPRRVRPTK